MKNLIAQANNAVSTAAIPPPQAIFDYAHPSGPLFFTSSTPSSGSVILIQPDPQTITGDTFKLYFNAVTTHTESFVINDPNKAVEFNLALSLIVANSDPDRLVSGQMYYDIIPVDSPVRQSGMLPFFVTSRAKTTPPPLAPGVDPDNFDPYSIPPPGLTVQFPSNKSILHARWVSYGKNGKLLYEETFNSNGTSVISQAVLNITERGGYVVIHYYGLNEDNILGPSLPLRLRVI